MEFTTLVHEYAHLCSAVGYVRSGPGEVATWRAKSEGTFRRLVNTARLPGVMCANVTTTTRYLNVKDDYLQELIERKPLVVIRELD